MIAASDRAKSIGGAGQVGEQPNSRYGRVLLFLMFVVLFLDAIPGFGIGIIRGLSAQNLYLYLLSLFIVARAVANPNGMRFVDLDIHIPFLSAMLYASLTLVVSGMFDPTYNEMRGIVAFKNRLLDLYLLFIVSRYFVSSYEDFLWLIRSIVVILFVFAFVTLLEFLGVVDIGIIGTFKGRIEGPFGDANQFGATLAFMLPVAIATMPARSTFIRGLWRLGVLTMILLLLGTGSRGAYVGVIAGSIISAVYLRDHLDMRTVGKIAAAGLAVLIVLGLGLAFFKAELVTQIMEKSTTGDIETASSGRWAIWSAALGVMLEAPYSFLVGYGWNTFETSGIWKSAHSEYVNWYFETGLIGLGIFVVLMLLIIRRTRVSLAGIAGPARRPIIGFAVGMIILAIDIAFVQVYNSWSIIWVVIGLTAGLQATAPARAEQRTAESAARVQPAN